MLLFFRNPHSKIFNRDNNFICIFFLETITLSASGEYLIDHLNMTVLLEILYLVIEYSMSMYNWSVDTAKLKGDPETMKIFTLEQAINFGLNNQKLNEADLRQYWHKLNLDPHKKRYLAKLLWPNQS